MQDRDSFFVKVDRHAIIFYPPAYFLTITSLAMQFR